MKLPAASGGVSSGMSSHKLNNLSCFILDSVSFLSWLWFLIYFLITFSEVAYPTVPMYLPTLQNSPPHSSCRLSLGNCSKIFLAVIDFIMLITRNGDILGGAPQKMWIWFRSKPTSSITISYLSEIPFKVSLIHSSTSLLSNTFLYLTAVTIW